MRVLDVGCGPGFFTLEAARMVGPAGQVIALDVQQGMLDKLHTAVHAAGLAGRVLPHLCRPDALGLSACVDLALVFHVAHEMPDQAALFRELSTLIVAGGVLLLVEPAFVVSRVEFAQARSHAVAAGFVVTAQPRIFLSRAAVLKNEPGPRLARVLF
jgi:ubiquinone/menaquinone biosynthesis C-methylase UbiE